MLKTLVITAALLLPLLGKAQTQTAPAPFTPPGETEEICVPQNPEICGHLHFKKAVDSKSEAEFILHIEVPQDAAVVNPQVALWMDMGGMSHRGAPVQIAALHDNHFEISNAWFVMAGVWTIKVDFNFENAPYHLEFPINITK